MGKHRKFDLLDAIVQAINDCNWNVLYVEDIKHHPFVLKIYNGEESYLLRIYIWNLTHGGGKKRPQDEYRIQITGVNRFIKQENEITLILGWWKNVGVFTGFDFEKHNGMLGKSPSIQIREENLRNAHINGISPCDRGSGEIAIAFRPDFFVDYIRNIRDLHQFGESKQDFEVLKQVTDKQVQINNQVLKRINLERQIAVTKITKKIRDNSFRARVLSAYGSSCAFCGIQLKLIDAAHILPVSVNGSSDKTANGIALCSLHHRAYDKSLVSFNEKYQILTNKKKFKQLREIKHDGGTDKFINDLRPIINVPPSINDRPHIDYIRQANSYRGW